MHDVPTIVLARRSYASDWDRQRLFSTLQEGFVPALLADGATLTANPRAADLFVVPAGTTNSEGMLEYLQHLRAYVRRALPYYN